MPCNCLPPTPTSPTGETLPSIGDLTQACANTTTCGDDCITPASSVEGGPVASCADGNALQSSASAGTTLANSYTDAIADHNSDGITILGRMGQKLAKFCGSGFLQLKDGKAVVVQSIQLAVSTLWHDWWKPDGINKSPVLGDPLPFPYAVVADSCGNLHNIQGVIGKNSQATWNGSQWVITDAGDLDICKNGKLPKLASLELVGLAPIGRSEDPLTQRCLSSLAGSGIIVVDQQSTVPDTDGCGDEVASNASVATFLPNPTVASTLKWSSGNGVHWSAD